MDNNHFIFKITLAFILSFSFSTFAQTDWVKWGKADYTYRINNPVEQRNYSFDLSNPGRFLLKSFANAYWLFISDVDGDNCSFSPTCSNFFIQAVERTNIMQGSLMFFDRFTRDMNIFGKVNHYPRVPGGHFFDPPSLYILDSDSINYIPPSVVVKNE
jgi:putative component of membrane protein insertase Oxa1/YidC/SpoIIIJ protein YidD